MEIVKSRLGIVDVPAVAQRIVGQCAVFIGRSGIDRQYSAPCVVFVIANDTITIGNSNHIALQVRNVEILRSIIIEIERYTFRIIVEL